VIDERGDSTDSARLGLGERNRIRRGLFAEWGRAATPDEVESGEEVRLPERRELFVPSPITDPYTSSHTARGKLAGREKEY
jgi:hypothetical protein